jgi:hypothetical protein
MASMLLAAYRCWVIFAFVPMDHKGGLGLWRNPLMHALIVDLEDGISGTAAYS